MSQTDKKADRFLRSRARPSGRRDRPNNRRDRSRANEPRPAYNTRAAANTGSDVEESGEEETMITPSESDDDDEPWNSSSRYEYSRLSLPAIRTYRGYRRWDKLQVYLLAYEGIEIE